MSASLVGSEMCIRDSRRTLRTSSPSAVLTRPFSSFALGLGFRGDFGQRGFAEGLPDFGAVTSRCRSSGSETPS
eukprot:5829665-Alexandrium_andersonii.AAC.1